MALWLIALGGLFTGYNEFLMQWCWLCFILLINYTWYKILTEVSIFALSNAAHTLVPPKQTSTIWLDPPKASDHWRLNPDDTGKLLLTLSEADHLLKATSASLGPQGSLYKTQYRPQSSASSSSPPPPPVFLAFRTCGATNIIIRSLLITYQKKCVCVPWIIQYTYWIPIQYHPGHLWTHNFTGNTLHKSTIPFLWTFSLNRFIAISSSAPHICIFPK